MLRGGTPSDEAQVWVDNAAREGDRQPPSPEGYWRYRDPEGGENILLAHPGEYEYVD